MPLAAGSRLGPYEIVAPLGAGGMGEVWRARDPKLQRDVAIKVLPASFAGDADRLARFRREAQTLALLDYPHIAHVYGFEESDGLHALVMELVEGDDLAARIARGPVPLDDAIEIARQIAEALEAAHEHGIVHRDLKPANVKLKADGTVKVLDFGLAKAIETAPSSATDLAHSPTLSAHATQLGVILGTAAYMAPEQARGRPVDKRADIWSFGALLWELLTGRRLFPGEEVSDVLAAVLRQEIDLAALPAGTPQRVRRLLARCLDRDPKRRLRDIGEARIALDPGVLTEPDSFSPPSVRAMSRDLSSWLGLTLATFLLIAFVWSLTSGARKNRDSDSAVVRTSILLPAQARDNLYPGMFAISPDGGAVTFVAAAEGGESMLWVRELRDLTAHALAGTEQAEQFPFWSPDGLDIGFASEGRLRRVPRSGGAVQTICDVSSLRGAAWSSDGTIVFAPGVLTPLMRVPATGGKPVPATVLDEATGEDSHRFPTFLPDGRRFLFGVEPADERGQIQIKVASLDSVSSGQPLLTAESVPRLAPSVRIVFARGQALLEQVLDSERLAPVGEPRLLEEEPVFTGAISSAPVADLARGGTMLYAARDSRPTEFVWLDREGRVDATISRLEGSFSSPLGGIAPRSDRLVAQRDEPGGGVSLWLLDLRTGSESRLTRRDRQIVAGTWTPDGRELVAMSATNAARSVVRIDSSTGDERILLPAVRFRTFPLAISADERYLVIERLTKAGSYDLHFLRLEDPAALSSFLETPTNEGNAVFSPDGKWVAYTSDVSGIVQAHIDRFPDRTVAERIRTQESVWGVYWPATSENELLLFVADGTKSSVLSCPIRTSPTLTIGVPRRLFELPADLRGVSVDPSGERFLLLRPVGERPAALTLVRNWDSGREGSH